VSIDELLTERLRGERMSTGQEDDLLSLMGDPRVGATLGGTWDRKRMHERLEANIAHWRAHGFGIWAWYERDSGDFVARAGLNHTIVGGGGEVEIGWAVMADRWGEGFGTEVARASAEAAFGEVGLDNVVAFTTPTNIGSRRVMEKAGFAYERDIVHADMPHVLYRLHASDVG
jgi:[ribosomal protein S5]-alanine N-acetyltransferase